MALGGKYRRSCINPPTKSPTKSFGVEMKTTLTLLQGFGIVMFKHPRRLLSSGGKPCRDQSGTCPRCGVPAQCYARAYPSQWVGSTANFKFPPIFCSRLKKEMVPQRCSPSNGLLRLSLRMKMLPSGPVVPARVAREHVMSAQGFREGQLSIHHRIPNVSGTILVGTSS